ncbi:NmrA-like protein [Macrophomina phaseolina MS6]|uniref:NmrA-like protein n=1 Tax=Macrophomina phaseolina (strain MS6) TaxID=1126212 RepID=K2S3B9_MACPH|nr:NmrA-like protein [Macrophomina phaseolina MS6]
MSRPVQSVALLGATGNLGSHILRALKKSGYTVTAVQRKESPNAAPAEADDSVKVNLSNKDELASVFKGKDAVVSAVPNPTLPDSKAMIDAAIAASVKRIIPSEYSTNLENTLTQKLPVVTEKVKIRQYLTSVIPSTTSSTTWTSINNGPFFEMVFKFGSLGPNLAEKKAVFHNGGDNYVGVSRLSDIGVAVAKVLSPEHFKETENQPVYIYSAAITQRYLTRLAAEVTGIDFGTVEDGRIADVDTDDMVRMADEKVAKGDMSAIFLYYFQIMFGRGYGGDFRNIAWNERLGLKTLTEEELKDFIRQTAKELGVLQ